jgi:hypothetical protein
MAMSRRARIRAYGSAGLAIVTGVVCGVVLGGPVGAALALALVGIGLVVITSLAFLEVGLSEDRARELEERRRPDRGHAAGTGAGPEREAVRGTAAARDRGRSPGTVNQRPRARPRAAGGLERLRGQRRRLR